MFAEGPDFNAWFPEIDGFPRPDWKVIHEFIRNRSHADHLEAAWQEITRVWLEKTCEKLAGSYTISESENFQVVSELDERRKKELLIFLERARAGILRTLADIPLPKRHGKHVVLRFTNDRDYYRYIAYFDPEGEYAGSSGRFLSGGYMQYSVSA